VSKVEKVLQLAQQIADQSVGFFELAGPGAGNRLTHAFMRGLRRRETYLAEHDFSEQKICGDNNPVDFRHSGTLCSRDGAEPGRAPLER
jgi:hypothetical protein